MALSTGFVVGYLTIGRIAPFLLPIITFPIFFVIFYQYVILNHFNGLHRGKFEYLYREHLIKKSANSIIKNLFGRGKLLILFLDELSVIGDIRVDIYKESLSNENIKGNKELEFLFYIKIARSARKEEDYDKEITYLKDATSIKPYDLTANYRLGNAYEKLNMRSNAIDSYNLALKDSLIDSVELKEFIKAQIDRVNRKGPCKKPPIPGLKYMIY